MYEAFVTAFFVYFVVIDLVGYTPIFLAVTQHKNFTRKLRTALEGTIVATMIMLFFALWQHWVLAYLNISEAAFHIAGGIILFLVALVCSALNAGSANTKSARLTLKQQRQTMSPSSRLQPLPWLVRRPSCG